MVFNDTTNYDFIYLASKAAPRWYIQLNQQLNMFFKIFGGNCLVALPWLRDQLARLVSVTWKQELQTSGISSKAINNLATQTGQLSRPVCWHDYGQTYYT